MNEVELELSRLFQTAVGDPPRRVTLRTVRRRVIRRRMIAGASATAAATLAVSVGVVVSANALGSHSVARPGHPTTIQRYYFEAGYPQTIFGRIRAVSTGEIKRRIECPRSRPMIDATAAASGRTFFISCATVNGTDIQIYRVAVGKSGQFGNLQPVPGGRVGGVRALDRFLNMAVTPSGSELAIATSQIFHGELTNIVVINTRTGAQALWRGAALRRGIGFGALDLSFTHDGGELGVFGYAYCTGKNNCGAPGGVLIVLKHPARGGRVASGRIVFRQRQLVNSPLDFVEDAYLSPDGEAVIASVFMRSRDAGATVYQISTATGRPARVLFHAPVEPRFIALNSFGRILFSGFKGNLSHLTVVNGWISDGRLIQLPTAGQVRTETW